MEVLNLLLPCLTVSPADVPEVKALSGFPMVGTEERLYSLRLRSELKPTSKAQKVYHIWLVWCPTLGTYLWTYVINIIQLKNLIIYSRTVFIFLLDLLFNNFFSSSKNPSYYVGYFLYEYMCVSIHGQQIQKWLSRVSNPQGIKNNNYQTLILYQLNSI